MINFLHTFHPNPILITLGPFDIYWYGVFIVVGNLLAFLIAFKLANYYKINKETIIDLVFWLIIGGIIGARLYHILLEASYYLNNPLDIFKIWQGGLAIHGAILAGLIIVWQFCRKRKLNFWLISAIIVPGVALAQVVGRWGNYFNQELFGKPTNLSWGIPIDIMNRPIEYLNNNFFHPTFLYESLSNFLIFLILITLHYLFIKNKIKCQVSNVRCQMLIVISYLILYSILRFFMEFLRTDPTYLIVGLRLPQIVSLLIIIGSLVILLPKLKKHANIQ